jgi:predicted permease
VLLGLTIRDAGTRASVLGDLHEDWVETRARRGRLGADLAYWRTALGVAVRYRGRVAGEAPRGRGNPLRSDARHAVRALRRAPGFAAVVVLTLGCGIGAAVLVFGIARAVVLRPLPFPEPERLVRIQELNPSGDAYSMSAANFLDLSERARTVSEPVAFSFDRLPMVGRGEPQQLPSMAVTRGFFRQLGVAPVVGRVFTADEYRTDSDGDVVIIAYGVWQRWFGGSPQVIGESVDLDGRMRTIVGVAPASMPSPFGVDVWLPFAPDPAFPRGDHRLEAIARLSPGVGIEAASMELQSIAAALGDEYPGTNAGWSLRVVPFHDWLIGSGTERAVTVLAGAVLLLLVLAGASVSNLLIVRTTARYRQVAMQTVLGAGRLRILRQFVIEAALLSVGGALVGIGVAVAAVTPIRQLGGAALPRLEQLSVTPSALVLAALIAAATTLLFGIGPALQAMRNGSANHLLGGARVVTRSTRRLRDALVSGQLAVALVLLVGAALLGASFARLARTDPGFEPERVLSVRVSPPEGRYPPSSEAVVQLYRQLGERIGALPGVVAVGATMVDPYQGYRPANRVGPESATELEALVEIQWRAVTPGLFRALSIPLLRGRPLDESDNDLGLAPDAQAPPVNVLLSASLADRLWPGDDPLGKRLVWNQPGGTVMTVVGVTGEVRDIDLAMPAAPMVYLPNGLVRWPEMTLMIRARSDPSALAPSLREAIHTVEPDIPVAGIRLLEQNLTAELAGSRLNLQLVGIFALAALLIATLGLYGITAYTVAQRTREMGIRIALGARPRGVVGLVLRQGVVLIVVGLALGTALALRLSRYLADILFEVPANDASTYVGVALLLAAIALFASWIPARRATRVDPRVSLNAE